MTYYYPTNCGVYSGGTWTTPTAAYDQNPATYAYKVSATKTGVVQGIAYTGFSGGQGELGWIEICWSGLVGSAYSSTLEDRVFASITLMSSNDNWGTTNYLTTVLDSSYEYPESLGTSTGFDSLLNYETFPIGSIWNLTNLQVRVAVQGIWFNNLDGTITNASAYVRIKELRITTTAPTPPAPLTVASKKVLRLR